MANDAAWTSRPNQCSLVSTIEDSVRTPRSRLPHFDRGSRAGLARRICHKRLTITPPAEAPVPRPPKFAVIGASSVRAPRPFGARSAEDCVCGAISKIVWFAFVRHPVVSIYDEMSYRSIPRSHQTPAMLRRGRRWQVAGVAGHSGTQAIGVIVRARAATVEKDARVFLLSSCGGGSFSCPDEADAEDCFRRFRLSRFSSDWS